MEKATRGEKTMIKDFCKRHFEKALFIFAVAGFFLIAHSAPAHGMTPVYNEPMVNETGLAYSSTFTLNVNNYKGDYMSLQVVYGSSNPAARTFTDGTASTGSITVVAAPPPTGLSTATASDFMTILATTGYSGAVVTVGGVALKEGVQWILDGTAATGTANTIKSAITTYVPNVVASVGSLSGKPVVFTTASYAGAQGNALTLASNTGSITVNSANFTGGSDNSCFSINGVPLCANLNFAVASSSAATALNIATAINANTSLNAVIVASAPAGCSAGATCGVVTTSATAVGTATNYAMYSSSKTALLLSGPASTFTSSSTANMTGGTNSAITLNSGNITVGGHGYTTALPVVYATSTAVGLTGLTWGTTYFIIPVDVNTVRLATTSANAVAGATYVTIASSSSQTSAHSFTLTPSTWTAGASWSYQASNDGTNWTTLATPATYSTGASGAQGSYVSPSTSTVTDIGLYDFSQFRVNVTAPTSGALRLTVTPNLKTNK